MSIADRANTCSAQTCRREITVIPTKIAPENALAIRQPLVVLRIIVAALALGVISFAVVTIVLNLDKPQALAGKLQPLNLVLLGMGLVVFPLGMLLPKIIFAAGRNSPPTGMAAGNLTPEELRVFAVQQRIQVSTIIGCALFEGGAFANLVGYLQTGEQLHLAVAAVLLIGILAYLPTSASYEQRIEDELRRQKEEEAFKHAP
jgi:hypothetical protein